MRNLNMGSIRSIERAIDVLQAFSIEKPELTLDELTQITKIPRSTVYRILCTLEGRGFVQFDEQSLRYRLGFRLIEFSTILFSALDVMKEAEAALIRLHEMTNQTVLMITKDGDEYVYVFKKENNKSGLKFASVVGERRPFTYGALGPVLLAYEPEEYIERILSSPIPPSTPYTLTDKEQYRRRLKKIREEHVFVQTDETSIGVTGIGAPVFNAKGEVIAAIGVVGPSVQLTDDALIRAKQLTMEAAREISGRMGYRMEGN